MVAASPHPFAQLDPARVVAAVESLGFWVANEPFALNSYENRVFSLRDEAGQRWVVKCYRPGRWSDDQIQEEHDFLKELDVARVPVSAPWRDADDRSLHHYEGYRLAMFPHVVGQAPELENPAHLFALGELLGHLHSVAERGRFSVRRRLDLDAMVAESRERVLACPWLTRRQRGTYERLTESLWRDLTPFAWSPASMIRVHGDCHLGNMLGRDEAFTLVDFDDAVMAPAVQDIWMLLTAQHDVDMRMQLAEILEGYEQWRAFDRRELSLIEPLRTLRLLRHSAWLVARWEDPAFPRAFPWVIEESFWEQHLRDLEQQRLALQSSPFWLA
ncbi:serine/threonine protein kinase [Aidingimonas halophila]|uniref:Stress response kinase A n=1 Tax=Aidingimonas halophila TaxID=574349 RepID=A0A1H3AXF9_9GAMM|nr:serine/threonine protein kinase [Aidingimonas halophila]GHC25418.1 stress response kinase A [Aidingimonas halophila]SDX33499.1 Ser/Thr protein kinase RdoA involved in Cpx stress response, MazF antagonist [Aidingimonas halophila]